VPTSRHLLFPTLLFLLSTCLPFVGVSRSGRIDAANDQTGAQSDEQQLVVLTATVKNKAGNFIMAVPRERFQVFDEKDERPIVSFENADVPLSIGILIDTSSSMEIYWLKNAAGDHPIGRAVQRLLETSNVDNEYFLMAFDKTPTLVADWAKAQVLLKTKPTLVYQKKYTALYDACVRAIEKLQTAPTGRRVLLVISDGQDNLSRTTFVQLRELLKRSDITLYAIGPLAPADVGSALGMEGGGILDELAEATGGEAFFPEGQKTLQEAFEFLSNELRHQYRLGFKVPKSSNASGKWHRLKVKLTSKPNAPEQFSKLSVRTRPGYYVP
jgi:Ca-activated chloride channel family protein